MTNFSQRKISSDTNIAMQGEKLKLKKQKNSIIIFYVTDEKHLNMRSHMTHT